MGIGVADVVVGKGRGFEYEGYADGGNVNSLPGRFKMNAGGIKLCSGMKVAWFASPAVIVTDQKLVSVMVNGSTLSTVVLV